MRKLKTDIKGLDTLFHGGIQVDNLTSTSNNHKRDSIIIVIRGEKGTHKHLLAMQLMLGLSKSIKNRLDENSETTGLIQKYPSRFYSINKSAQCLNDMFIDMLIRRWLDAMTRAIKRKKISMIGKDDVPEGMTIAGNERGRALKFWFEDKTSPKQSPSFKREKIAESYSDNLIDLLSDNLIYYNTRTNSLHFRRLAEGDSNDNLLFKRRYDTIDAYLKDYNNGDPDLKGYTEITECYRLADEMVNIVFFQDKDTKDSQIDRFSQKASIRFFNILQNIEEGDKKEKSECKDDENRTTKAENNVFVQPKEELQREVIVIDGFSHIDSKSLKALPFDHLQDILRKTARISILVFDDRLDMSCDGDIIIDLRKSYDESEDYTYSELQISKCTFQTHALGWHQYKRRDEGIVVFPSIHLLLTKRHYIANMANDIGKSILDITYAQYAEARLYTDNISGRLAPMLITNEKDSHDNMSNYANDFYYPDYKKRADLSAEKYLKKLFEIQMELNPIENVEGGGSGQPFSLKYIKSGNQDPMNPNQIFDMVLRNSLLGERPDKKSEEFGWVDHYASTAVIGNPNSYKRRLVLGKAFHWAKLKEHVLFVLFDKNEEDLRRQMTCPGMFGKAQEYFNGERCNKKNEWNCSDCLLCYKYIHFFRIRSGCISPEEFFVALLEQISVYCDEETKYGIERHRMHIVIDDFQRIDFCFPFIKRSSLFTDALINLCHLHNVELTVLCDKSGERAREVCTLADNVVCVERNEHDINNISIFIERSSVAPFPSTILKYEVPDVQNLFVCKDEKLDITSEKDRVPTPIIIGSMKEYWRQTMNAHIKD